MNIFKRVSVLVIAFSLIIAPVSAPSAHAASVPPLGTAGTYGILSGTFTRNVGTTAITGDVGYVTLGGSGTHTVTGATVVTPGAQVGTDQAAALSALNAEACTFTFAAGAIDLATDTTHGTIGVYPPGVYCTLGAASIGTAGITLTGGGAHIFRIAGALTTVNNSNVALADGASSCEAFWTPSSATTLGANTTFKGIVIDDSGITVGNMTTWLGRALSFAGTVTTDTSVINSTCSAALNSGGGQKYGNINVVKVVINDSGGTKKVSDFPLFVNGTPIVSGVTKQFPAPALAYTVTETKNAGYTQVFSGDCDSDGRIALSPGDNNFCIITNNDNGAPVVIAPVPPQIDVVKVPSPLSLPVGGGAVAYTYTLTNIGTVPVTDISMVGDTCSPIILASGDTNNNKILEVNEVWRHTCSATLSETHTNIVSTTGWANGISAVDIASATVVVGGSTAPLIHVTKIPSKISLPAGGGVIVYTKKVTNPGMVALSNVRVTDDKCSTVAFVGGDTNSDAKLDTSETWTYVCTQNLTQTTINTATARGDANGLTARDIAVAVVTVAVPPKLPNTGYAPHGIFTSPFSWFLGFVRSFAI